MLSVGKFIPPKTLPYSFLKDLYGIHQFYVNSQNVYYTTQIVNVPFNIARGVFTQESVTFPQAFNVDVVVLAPFEIEVNTQRIQGYGFVQLGSQSAISVKGLGQVFFWISQNFSFPSYVPFQYIIENDYAYDVYLHTLGLHEAVLQYLNNGKEIHDVFFDETGINEVLYYLKHKCVQNREKFALGVVILQILYPYNPFNLPYGQSYGETYQNALEVQSCYDQLSEEISETQSELIQDSEILQEQIYQLSEDLIQTSENLQDQINYLSENLVNTQFELLETSENLQNQINTLSEEVIYLQSEVSSEEGQIQTLFGNFYQVSECCYTLTSNSVIQLAETVQCLANTVLNILAILPPGLVKKILGNLASCPLGSEIQVSINGSSESSESNEEVIYMIRGLGRGLGHKLHKVGRGLGHLMGKHDPFIDVTEGLLESLNNLLNASVNYYFTTSEASEPNNNNNSSSESNPNNTNSNSESPVNNSNGNPNNSGNLNNSENPNNSGNPNNNVIPNNNGNPNNNNQISSLL